MNDQQVSDSSEKLIADRFVPLVMAILATLFTWLLVQAIDFSTIGRPIAFGVLSAATLLKQRWLIYGGLGVALATQLGEFRGVRDSGESLVLQADDVYFTFILICYATFALRYTDLTKHYQATLVANPVQSTNWIRLRPFLAGWAWLPIAMVMAVIVLGVIPWDSSTIERYRITPTGMRAIGIVWLLFLIWFLLDGMFALLTRRHPDPMRARVFARSAWCRGMASELSGIEKHRVRRINKQLRADNALEK